MEALTEPHNPIIIVGTEFPLWKYLGYRKSMIEVVMDAGWGQAFMGNLGQYIPGLLENGDAVEFYVSTVNYQRINVYTALLIPETHPRRASA
jgi:hypothetical protein